MQFSPKTKLLTISILGITLFLALVWLNFVFLQDKLNQEKNTVVDSRVNIELNNRQKQNLSTLTKQLDQIQESSDALNQAVLDRKQALKFVEYVEGLAAQFGVEHDLKITEPSRKPTGTDKTYILEEKSFSLTLDGAVENLLNFLKTFEANSSYVLISNLSLQKGENNLANLSLAGVIPWH
ncbi:hypothetical protein C4546_02950 [Candidatus Parcubacteria bacterium]|jgi:Tfp pilus assembly protein PilO|nr:MAG: hypothetical protein C4546_02950 [Candidatus Parcubacteria bacterium]